MFRIVVFGLCFTNCLAAYSKGDANPGSTPSGERGARSTCRQLGCSSGIASKSLVQPNLYYSQQGVQPIGETMLSYTGATGGYSKSHPPTTSFGSYSGQSQPLFTSTQSFDGGAHKNGFSSYDSYQGGEYPIVTAEGYLKDTPEVAEAKKAHLAEKMRISKYVGSDQYSEAASASQYYTPSHGTHQEAAGFQYQAAPQYQAALQYQAAPQRTAYHSKGQVVYDPTHSVPVSGGFGVPQGSTYASGGQAIGLPGGVVGSTHSGTVPGVVGASSRMFSGSYYNSPSSGMATGMPESSQGYTVSRKKRSIPCAPLPLLDPAFHALPAPLPLHEPVFHALPAPLPLYEPAFHPLPAPSFYSHGPLLHHSTVHDDDCSL